MEAVKKQLEGRIDYEGQRLSEQVAYFSLVVSGVIAFFVSFLASSIKFGLIVFAAGYVITLLAVVPPWPVYRKHPIAWLPVRRLKAD
ncbi:hypothetical protein FFLO_03354 [Filobasidium floriforme]|uniref:Signal peptidase complex subunit 1 n=1 Tax=Filobasidium floriforme TaxID=5210 RepID=A0A8K0JL85_9TREE|nr:microsomal signal peptidase subunit [Filobasidium floriforme]KAG7544241.1 hypothetical protein FFLO_03354 [Filobasidium floriforme]KAH8085734.1 microsomal signal peptidase subunit [Filobasidium floriforme]